MADPFQPKFVDLVRNFTSTAGTGNLVLGDAAPGFTSFTSALQPGDGFYYSVVGLEKTTETEVGRGTLQADGSIARSAISGTLTDFSPGRKSVALVAAAEWFDSIEAVRGAPALANSRTALAGLLPTGSALLDEAGRGGVFIFEDRDLSAEVAADSAQGIYVAPASDPSGASGAWVRQYDGPVQFDWFGAVNGESGASGANSAANDSAVAAMLSCLGALAVNPVGGSNAQGLPPVEFGEGTYEFATPIELTNGSVAIGGRGMGHGSATKSSATTRLKFYGCTGIRIHSANTSGASTKDGPHNKGSYSSIHDLAIEGSFAGTEAEHHGVHMRGQGLLTRVSIRGFAGDGIFVDADTGDAGGNCSNWVAENVAIWGCRDGIRTLGNNSGAGKASGSVQFNRRWGVNEAGGIGNTYTITTAYNGLTPDNDGVDIGAAWVSHGGNRYGAIAGEEAGASVNAPSGTAADNQWWYHIQSGAEDTSLGCVAWSSGMLVRAGGAIRDSQAASKSTYIGCYTENSGPKAQICQRSAVIGGHLSTWCFQNPAAGEGSSILRSGSDGVVCIEPALEVSSGSVVARLGANIGNPNNIILNAIHPTIAANSFSLRCNSANGSISWNDGSAVIAHMTTSATAQQFGTGAAVAQALYPSRLMLGPAIADARQVTIDAAAPASGAHAQGELVFYRGPEPNLIGWNCIAAGMPGTWQGLFGLTQLQAAGSGLTVSGGDLLLGRSTAGGGAIEEILCTAAGRALLDDSDAAEQRATLGLGTAALMAAEWALNFTADGQAYIPAAEAMTVEQGNAAIGTGTLAFERSSAAAPDQFSSTELPVSLEAGAWLRVSASGVGAFIAAHLKRTA